MKIRFEIMIIIKDEVEANKVADKLFNYMEDTLKYDCAIVVMNADTETELVE
tara:strand:- start:5999 stop:6154 length:156 start_codon:yes stop_codon:yes gene_type:complete